MEVSWWFYGGLMVVLWWFYGDSIGFNGISMMLGEF